MDDLTESAIAEEEVGIRFLYFSLLFIMINILCIILPGRKVFGFNDQVADVDDKATLFLCKQFAVLVGDETQLLQVVIFYMVLDAVVS